MERAILDFSQDCIDIVCSLISQLFPRFGERQDRRFVEASQDSGEALGGIIVVGVVERLMRRRWGLISMIHLEHRCECQQGSREVNVRFVKQLLSVFLRLRFDVYCRTGVP